MKDFILGSEEFLIRSHEMVEEFFKRNGTPTLREDQPEDDLSLVNDLSPDDHVLDDPTSGQTTIHSFSTLIHDLSLLHDEIARARSLRVSKTLRDTSAALFRLQQRMKGEASRDRRQELHEEVLRLQQALKVDIEAKDTASRMRINNFYKTVTGKMQPAT